MNIADMRTTHSRDAYAQLREAFGEKVFETVIRASIAYAESAEKALSILEYRPDLGADYLALADEVLARIGREDARGALAPMRLHWAPGMGIRVFHCDDSEAFTRLVAFWLSEHDDIEHVGAGAHGRGGAGRAARGQRRTWSCSTRSAGPATTRCCWRSARPRPNAKVIVYSGYVRLMQEGALGHEADAYLEKGDDEGPLLDAIRVGRGTAPLDATLVTGPRCSATKPCCTTAPTDFSPARCRTSAKARRGEPILVAVGADKIAALRAALGADAAGIDFADMAEVGHNPARIIPAWRDSRTRTPGRSAASASRSGPAAAAPNWSSASSTRRC